MSSCSSSRVCAAAIGCTSHGTVSRLEAMSLIRLLSFSRATLSERFERLAWSFRLHRLNMRECDR